MPSKLRIIVFRKLFYILVFCLCFYYMPSDDAGAVSIRPTFEMTLADYFMHTDIMIKRANFSHQWDQK